MLQRALSYRKYSLLRVNDPGDPHLRKAINENFVVNRKVSTRVRGRTKYTIVPEPCFQVFDDDNGGKYYLIGYGFIDKLCALFEVYGYELDCIDINPVTKQSAKRFIPDQKFLAKTKWRDNQLDIITDLMSHDTGQYVAATGAGKSYIIRKLCKIYPKAKFLITTYSQSVLKDLWEDVSLKGGVDAGIYCSSKKQPGGRVQFCSIGCLSEFLDEEWDFLLLDEKHECATIKRMQPLMAVDCRRAFAFSANHDDRNDDADPWLEYVFGDNRVQSTYLQSVDQNDIVPVKVNWVRVKNETFPDVNPSSPGFEREVFWQHETRNQIIAELALDRMQKQQTLVYAKTLEHVYVLRKLLDCPVAHAEPTKDRWAELILQGLVDPSEERPKRKDLEQTKLDFSEGKIQLAICNSVWKRGVNFPALKTLIRADGGSSHQDSTQIPGRLTRLYKGKKYGELIDFIDEFHDSTRGRASKRKSSYDEIGYEQPKWRDVK
jgi:superfamily II DNA or RNA helicase